MPSAANENEHEHEHVRESKAAKPPELQVKPAGPGPGFASPETAVQDLSPELMRELPRSPDELVRCRRVIGNHYRCNWWAPRDTAQDKPGFDGLAATTYRVVQSQMLRATLTAEGLLIERGPRQ